MVEGDEDISFACNVRDKIRIDQMRKCEPGAENHYLEIASRGNFGIGWARNDGDVCEGGVLDSVVGVVVL